GGPGPRSSCSSVKEARVRRERRERSLVMREPQEALSPRWHGQSFELTCGAVQVWRIAAQAAVAIQGSTATADGPGSTCIESAASVSAAASATALSVSRVEPASNWNASWSDASASYTRAI